MPIQSAGASCPEWSSHPQQTAGPLLPQSQQTSQDPSGLHRWVNARQCPAEPAVEIGTYVLAMLPFPPRQPPALRHQTSFLLIQHHTHLFSDTPIHRVRLLAQHQHQVSRQSIHCLLPIPFKHQPVALARPPPAARQQQQEHRNQSRSDQQQVIDCAAICV